MNRDIMDTLTAQGKSEKPSMNGTGTLSLDFVSTGLMSTMPVVSAAAHPLTTAEHRLQQLQEQLERHERQEAVISEMDTVSTLTTVKAPKFDPNSRTKIKNHSNLSTKAQTQRNNARGLRDASLKKSKSTKSSRTGSSSQQKNPSLKPKTSKKSYGNKENIDTKKKVAKTLKGSKVTNYKRQEVPLDHHQEVQIHHLGIEAKRQSLETLQQELNNISAITVEKTFIKSEKAVKFENKLF